MTDFDDNSPAAAGLRLGRRGFLSGAAAMTVAAALEYMYNKPDHAQATGSNEVEEEEDDEEIEDPDEAAARTREEAGADWMVEQGFDRKE